MRPYDQSTRLIYKLSLATLLLAATAVAVAQDKDLLQGVTYVCSGERMFIESCNMRDTSDTSICMVGHPDHIMPNGLMQYTNATRGALKKLFPTCTQPSAKQVAAAQAFQKKQQDTYNANVQKANDQLKAAAQPVPYGQPQKPKSADDRAMNRCITSGRVPATCMGNTLLGGFSQMLAQVLPTTDAKGPTAGPNMAGVFEGAGNWRIDFIDGGVLVNCSFLSPDQHFYTLDLKGARPIITINTTPKPLILTIRADGTMSAPGPFVLDGVVATGTSSDGPDPNASSGYYDKNGMALSNSQASSSSADLYTAGGYRHYGSVSSGSTHTNFASRRATCPALNLSSKGASVGAQTMQTDLLKTMFGGDKGPPTPAGIRMIGIFAASTGFSVQFFPESAIVGCGPDAARAYPYTVEADGGHVAVKIAAPDRPLSLTFAPNGALDPGSGPYQVHGRTVVGQDDNDNFTFAPFEQSCNLALLTPSKDIPSGGGANTMVAAGTPGTTSASGAAAAPSNNGGTLSVPGATLGNATLSIVSGLPPQPNTPSPLAGRPFLLLRDSYANALAKGGVTVPPGVSPYKYVGTVCGTNAPDCQKSKDAIKVAAASAVRGDANGQGTFPGVAPGTYYLMISILYNKQPYVWGQAVQLKPGANTLSLDLRSATPIN